MSITSPIISVRVNPSERDLLETAAERARTSLSDFVRRTAIEAAETEILSRRSVVIPAEHWEEFEAWLDRPPRDIPALKALAAKRPIWER
jgi:uncharacterized protein (DUF1778 family)